jgi:hypothetical protein
MTNSDMAVSSGSSSSAIDSSYDEEPIKLREHVMATYLSLRIGIAFLGGILPPLLVVVGWIAGRVGLQSSMSAYYYAGNGAARNEFVGILITIGAFLYLYKGFSQEENIALNLAGIFALGVALVPMPWDCADNCARISAHGVFAISFFICIAYVCLARAMDTLPLLQDVYANDPDRAKSRIAFYKRRYRILGWAMIGSPLAALIWNSTLRQSSAVFYIEAFAVWVFAAYWLYKSKEMRESSAEQRAMAGGLRRVKRHKRMLPDDAAVVAK